MSLRALWSLLGSDGSGDGPWVETTRALGSGPRGEPGCEVLGMRNPCSRREPSSRASSRSCACTASRIVRALRNAVSLSVMLLARTTSNHFRLTFARLSCSNRLASSCLFRSQIISTSRSSTPRIEISSNSCKDFLGYRNVPVCRVYNLVRVSESSIIKFRRRQ